MYSKLCLIKDYNIPWKQSIERSNIKSNEMTIKTLKLTNHVLKRMLYQMKIILFHIQVIEELLNGGRS